LVVGGDELNLLAEHLAAKILIAIFAASIEYLPP
jgi:hypothetical protein